MNWGDDNTPRDPWPQPGAGPDPGPAPSPPPHAAPPPAPLPPTFARPMSDGRIDPDLAINHDKPCGRCGYNLRTRRMGEQCPECGSPVRLSFIEPGPGPGESMYGKTSSATVCLTMGILSLALGFNTWGAATIIFGPLGIGFYFKYQSEVRRGVASFTPRTRRTARAGLICSLISLGLGLLVAAIVTLVVFNQ